MPRPTRAATSILNATTPRATPKVSRSRPPPPASKVSSPALARADPAANHPGNFPEGSKPRPTCARDRQQPLRPAAPMTRGKAFAVPKGERTSQLLQATSKARPPVAGASNAPPKRASTLLQATSKAHPAALRRVVKDWRYLNATTREPLLQPSSRATTTPSTPPTRAIRPPAAAASHLSSTPLREVQRDRDPADGSDVQVYLEDLPGFKWTETRPPTDIPVGGASLVAPFSIIEAPHGRQTQSFADRLHNDHFVSGLTKRRPPAGAPNVSISVPPSGIESPNGRLQPPLSATEAPNRSILGAKAAPKPALPLTGHTLATKLESNGCNMPPLSAKEAPDGAIVGAKWAPRAHNLHGLVDAFVCFLSAFLTASPQGNTPFNFISVFLNL